MYKSSNFSTSSPTLFIVCLITAILVGWSGISRFWFVCFWWLTTLNVFLFSHWWSYIFFGEMCIQILSPFLNSVICIFVMSSETSLDILTINSLSGMWVLNRFSHFIDYLFTLLTVSFTAQKVMILMLELQVLLLPWLCDEKANENFSFFEMGVSKSASATSRISPRLACLFSLFPSPV